MKAVFFVHNRDFFGAKLIHIPALYALKSNSNISQVIALTPYEENGLFADLGLVHEVHSYAKGIGSPLGIIRKIKPDLVFSTRPESTGCNVATRFSGAKERHGFITKMGNAIYTNQVPNDLDVYRAVNFLNLLGHYGETADTRDFFKNEWKFQESKKSNQIVIMPGGSNDYKRWGIDKYLNLASLIPGPSHFLFVLGQQEIDYIPRIESAGHRVLLNASPKDIVAELAKSKLVIANDCGPAHLAQMLKIPIVLVMSDYDGNGPIRAAEWFYAHPRAKLFMSAKGEALQNASPKRVLPFVLEAMG